MEVACSASFFRALAIVEAQRRGADDEAIWPGARAQRNQDLLLQRRARPGSVHVSSGDQRRARPLPGRVRWMAGMCVSSIRCLSVRTSEIQ